MCAYYLYIIYFLKDSEQQPSYIFKGLLIESGWYVCMYVYGVILSGLSVCLALVAALITFYFARSALG